MLNLGSNLNLLGVKHHRAFQNKVPQLQLGQGVRLLQMALIRIRAMTIKH
jgi:hypothetical protein